MMKSCKECPWKISNRHNDMIVGFSKRMDKPHNCHMKNGGENLWDLKEETKCNGRKKYEENRNTRRTQRQTTGEI